MLLVTLLIANMLVNETLPVICDPILGGGFQGVAVSTVLIIMYVFVLSLSLRFFRYRMTLPISALNR